MSAIAIGNNVYWIGVKDPELPVFDIVMETKHGTTYNAYLVRGEKTAVIDTVKQGFTAEFLANVSSIVEPEKIDYLIVNHTEPDHAGAIVDLIELNPKIQIVCSGSALPFVKSTINREANVVAVKDDTVIDLGGKKLQFKIMPYMHWPDTMMEYLIEDRVLFSCDGFAAHVAGQSLFADELANKLASDGTPYDLDYEMRYYFDAIMRPFSGYIRRNMAKLESLEPALLATSHGPVYRRDVRRYIDRYKEWTVDKSDPRRVTLFYASNYGNTRRLADVLAQELGSSNFDVSLIDASTCKPEEAQDLIEASGAVIIGTPTFNGDAPKPIWDLVNLFSTVYSTGKKAAVFGSYGWGGEGSKMVAERLTGLKLKVFPEPFRARLIPSEEEITGARTFATELAQFFA